MRISQARVPTCLPIRCLFGRISLAAERLLRQNLRISEKRRARAQSLCGWHLVIFLAVRFGTAGRGWPRLLSIISDCLSSHRRRSATSIARISLGRRRGRSDTNCSFETARLTSPNHRVDSIRSHGDKSSACALGEQHLQQSTTTLLRILAARSFATRSPPASPRLSITARTCSLVPLPHVAPHFALVPTTPYHRFRGRYRHVQIPQPWSFRQNRRSFHSLIEPHSARPEGGASSTLGRTGPEQLSIALH